MPAVDVRAALRAAAAAGPYFAVDIDAAGPWRPFAELLDDPACVADRVGVVRDALTASAGAEVELRVAASIHFLALASRLVAPPLATATLAGIVPHWTPDALGWQPVPGGPVPLRVTRPTGVLITDEDDAASALHEHVIVPVLEPLVAAFGIVSPTVLRGNVASALAGAARMLRPALLDPRRVVVAALQTPLLTGTGTVEGRGFRRSSCCLFYRVPGGGYCGDCVLA